MNVNEALEYAKKSICGVASDVLATEVKRLREQRKALYDIIPDGGGVPIAIWQEIHKERLGKEKKMTVDEAVEYAPRFGVNGVTDVLAAEVKSLRRVHIELNIEIHRLHKACVTRDDEIELLIKDRERRDMEIDRLHEVIENREYIK